MPVVKLTVNLAEDVAQALKEMADRRGISITEAVRRAISTEKFIEDETAAGSKVLVEDKDKTIRQVVFR